MIVVQAGRVAALGMVVAVAACGQSTSKQADTVNSEVAAAVQEISPDAPAIMQAARATPAENFDSATIIHFEVTGVVTDPHTQIPAADADQYGDVTEKVTLSFDWDKSAMTFAGAPKFSNLPATVTNLTGMEAGCPGGELKGPYEHFDIVGLKADGSGAIELIGVRKHPDTLVAESCGSGLRSYAAADKPVSMWTAPPDPALLQLGAMLPPESGLKVSPDGQSMILTAQNDNWVWTFTPSVK